MEWQRVTATEPSNDADQHIILANDWGIMGEFSSRRPAQEFDEEAEEAWWINDDYYDGESPPVWFIVLPPFPQD